MRRTRAVYRRGKLLTDAIPHRRGCRVGLTALATEYRHIYPVRTTQRPHVPDLLGALLAVRRTTHWGRARNLNVDLVYDLPYFGVNGSQSKI